MANKILEDLVTESISTESDVVDDTALLNKNVDESESENPYDDSDNKINKLNIPGYKELDNINEYFRFARSNIDTNSRIYANTLKQIVNSLSRDGTHGLFYHLMKTSDFFEIDRRAGREVDENIVTLGRTVLMVKKGNRTQEFFKFVNDGGSFEQIDKYFIDIYINKQIGQYNIFGISNSESTFESRFYTLIMIVLNHELTIHAKKLCDIITSQNSGEDIFVLLQNEATTSSIELHHQDLTSISSLYNQVNNELLEYFKGWVSNEKRAKHPEPPVPLTQATEHAIYDLIINDGKNQVNAAFASTYNNYLLNMSSQIEMGGENISRSVQNQQYFDILNHKYARFSYSTPTYYYATENYYRESTETIIDLPDE